MLYTMGNYQYIENIQIKLWKSFVLVWLVILMFIYHISKKNLKNKNQSNFIWFGLWVIQY